MPWKRQKSTPQNKINVVFVKKKNQFIELLLS